MRRIEVDVDTSVFGGIDDEEFKVHWRFPMPATLNSFDCVKMKNEIQAKLLAEYERMEGQAGSFAEFIEAKGHKSDWVKAMREKMASPRSEKK